MDSSVGTDLVMPVYVQNIPEGYWRWTSHNINNLVQVESKATGLSVIGLSVTGLSVGP